MVLKSLLANQDLHTEGTRILQVWPFDMEVQKVVTHARDATKHSSAPLRDQEVKKDLLKGGEGIILKHSF